MRPVAAAFSLVLLSLACSGDPVAPRQLDLNPSFTVNNSNGGLNVFRGPGEFAVGFADVDDDLFAIAGLPSNPDDFVGCGGVEGFQLTNWQFVGLLQGTVKALVKNVDANLFVFKWSTFVGCGSVPIAGGVGQVTYTDSDIFYTGGKEDSWGFQMEGTVTLAGGGKAHLLAHTRLHIQPDGTFRETFTDIKLTRQ